MLHYKKLVATYSVPASYAAADVRDAAHATIAIANEIPERRIALIILRASGQKWPTAAMPPCPGDTTGTITR